MSWSVGLCSRPGCMNPAAQMYIFKDSKWHFHHPIFFCWDCYYFMQIDFSQKFKDLTSPKIKLLGK